MTTSKIVTEADFNNICYQPVGDMTYASGVVVLAREFVESAKWVEVWELVWSENDGKNLFSYYYEMPSTELQQGSESDFDADGIREVVAEEVTVTKYTRIEPKPRKQKKADFDNSPWN